MNKPKPLNEPKPLSEMGQPHIWVDVIFGIASFIVIILMILLWLGVV